MEDYGLLRGQTIKLIAMLQVLKQIAESSIAHNTLDSLEGPVISAGGHQFKTLWTRDFCFSVPGLLASGNSHLVENQLEVILKRLRSYDNLLPRGIDSYPPQLRVVLHTVGRWIPGRSSLLGYKRPLKAEYLGEHRTIAFDSNLLTLMACAQYGKLKPQWFEKNLTTFHKVFRYYDQYFLKGLLHQPPFSDWQDSARRRGSVLYSQMLYLKVLTLFKQLGHPLQSFVPLRDFTTELHRQFYNTELGLYGVQPGSVQIPLESNLWAIELGLFEDLIDTRQLYETLKNHPLWKAAGVPGLPVYPRYPSNEISWTCKAVGLTGYHDSYLWSWLIAESARIACLQNDMATAQAILEWLEIRAQQDSTIYEIYQPTALGLAKPVETWLYQSESPFTWGAAKILEAISTFSSYLK